jgi:Oxidoreductase family, NAD-binding Rossmann fold
MYIFGNKGNMGRRYAAVLKLLEHEAVGGDVGDEVPDDRDFGNYDGFIIATPTDTHLDYIEFLLKCGKPVLCEKPFTTNAGAQLRNVLQEAKAEKMQLSMVSQYDFLGFQGSYGPTSYDYYKSGPDGLAWDCINIIRKAKASIRLKNESPIWKCTINGTALCPNMMDQSYIEMIDSWLHKPYEPQYDMILAAHEKVADYLKGGAVKWTN